MVDRREVRAGLSETRRYLLSHHHPSEWYRCYAPVVGGRQLHICARCAGIYPGIVTGFIAYAFISADFSWLVIVAILPLPALLDWAATNFTRRRGFNAIRTATGGLLGFGYGIGVGLLLIDVDLRVLVVGIGYGVAAGFLLAVHRRVVSRENRQDRASSPDVD